MTDTDISVDVLIKDTRWNTLIETLDSFCVRVIDAVNQIAGNFTSGDVSIALVDDAEIRALNKTYRGKDKATNVLSFPNAGPAPILGDIVIARETIIKEAAAAAISVSDHLSHMLVHGFLHLQGYDHEDDSDAEIMEALEIKALQALNIDNPYKINEL